METSNDEALQRNNEDLNKKLASNKTETQSPS